jgi:hypothetical protein
MALKLEPTDNYARERLEMIKKLSE